MTAKPEFCKCGALLGSIKYAVDARWVCGTCYSQFLANQNRRIGTRGQAGEG